MLALKALRGAQLSEGSIQMPQEGHKKYLKTQTSLEVYNL